MSIHLSSSPASRQLLSQSFSPRLRWEHFAHGSDIGIRGVGSQMQDAFRMAALALTAIVTDPKLVRDELEISISCQAEDRDFLFYDWLNAIIFEMDRRQMLFSRIEIGEISDTSLRARLGGEHLSTQRHHPTVDIKGATFTALGVFRIERGWVAQCVVDV